VKTFKLTLNAPAPPVIADVTNVSIPSMPFPFVATTTLPELNITATTVVQANVVVKIGNGTAIVATIPAASSGVVWPASPWTIGDVESWAIACGVGPLVAGETEVKIQLSDAYGGVSGEKVFTFTLVESSALPVSGGGAASGGGGGGVASGGGGGGGGGVASLAAPNSKGDSPGLGGGAVAGIVVGVVVVVAAVAAVLIYFFVLKKKGAQDEDVVPAADAATPEPPEEPKPSE
jgi:hypothetical protein